jgi:hypothetical protein
MRYNPETTIVKANLTKDLTDAAKIELITYLTPEMVKNFSIIKALMDSENADKRKYNIDVEDNILSDVVYYITLMSPSINAIRSEQLVRVLNAKTEEAKNTREVITNKPA